ncbi:unnamed protein product, partial [Ascophyllum nodosum]
MVPATPEPSADDDLPVGGDSSIKDTTTGTADAPVSMSAKEYESSRRDETGLAAISTLIDNNLSLFRTGAATMVVGSGLTVAFLLYRRGVHGYTCASQVPVSMFERRARVRVRVAKITTVPPPPTEANRATTSTSTSRVRSGPPSDVVLHAEHITLLRRILRLRPRSLFPGATTESAASLTLRMCGVSVEKEGAALARQELVRPLVGNYCDAELLFREQQLAPPAGGLGSAGFGFGGGSQAPLPVAVCHIHRRRGVLWRDLIQPRLDPQTGFGEHLVSQGVARLRDEVWWGVGAGGDTTARSAAGMGTGDSEYLPALKRLLTDRDRLEAAENGARKADRGLWAGSPPSEGRDPTSAAAAAEGGG